MTTDDPSIEGGEDESLSFEEEFDRIATLAFAGNRKLDHLIELVDDLRGTRFRGYHPSDETTQKNRERARCPGGVLGEGLCGALEGELHQFGCDMERCTKCSGQFLYCDCPEPPEERKRVPFFRLAWHRCERCGVPWPPFFVVPNDVWEHYILRLGDGDKMLCVDCFNLIAELTDGCSYAKQHGVPRMLNFDGPER